MRNGILGFSEPMASSPLWLAYSGLPAWLNSKIHRHAWLVFKTVVEIDCALNARPATVEIAPAEIAERCGLAPDATMKTLEALRRKKCLALFLPEHPEERALIEVKTPLPTPRAAEEVRAQFPFNRLDPAVRLRYASASEPETDKGTARGGKKDLERVIDLYFNTVGFKMNSFILDELRLVCQRFPRSDVEKTFARARKNDIRSLGWIVRELYRLGRRRDTGDDRKTAGKGRRK
ncbi:hypothetical protein JW916_10800 [Candidatus Sumerlaeota bacterium]|nr:hypothetical protein [Candidatus Sumerlaeota bacterium]